MKPSQITDFSNIHYDTGVLGDCKWVKVAKQYPSGGWTQHTWTSVDKLIEFRRRCKSTLIFHTLNHYSEADTEKPQLCDLVFECDVGGETEFEQKQNFKRMQNTVDALYRFFYGDLGLLDGQIRFFFTGGRSIHIVVMNQPFGVEPMVELNQVMKQIAKYFNSGLLDWDEYHPLDEALYSNPRMFRMPNSYYPKYDAWKIEISPQEFDLPEAELRKLAKEPRPPLYNLSEISTELIPEAVEWYQERLQEFQELQKEREHIPTDPRVLKKLSFLPACIADLRTNTISKEGTRNQATLLDATFCKSTDVPKQDAIVSIDEWVQRIPKHLTSCKPGKARTIATKSVVESVYRGKQYKFACGYVQALGLECSREACPLYEKKAFQKWGKKVKVIPNFTPTYSGVLIPIGELRTALAGKVSENGCNLLLHAAPGVGKTETTLITLDPLGNILYSASRRDMLDEPMSLIVHSAPQLIKPREPVGAKPLKDDPPEVKEAYEKSALCKYYKKANALAAKRWNVAKMLCSRKCEIGMAKCPYWKQFKVWGSSLVTHQILSIPYHMDSLISDNNPTIVFDEPNPQTLIEQVNITATVVTEEMARRKNPDIVKFLSLIRDVVEKHNGTYTTGKAVIQRLVDAYDGDLESLLDAVVGWLSVPDDYVEIQVDSISAQSTEKAWLVIIDSGEHWIPRSLCFESDIENKRLMIPYWLAEQKGIDYDIAEKEETEDVKGGDIPLNFLNDLTTVLYDEFQKYKTGKEYNSRLALTTTLMRPCLRMNLRKHLAIPNCRLILLDAFGDAELLSKLTGRKIEAWTLPMAVDVEVIQIVDGYYGITTMWKKQFKDEGGGIPRKTLNRLIKAAQNIAEKDPEGTLIITWKFIHQYIEKLQKEGKFDSRVVVDHFGNIEGTNRHENKQQVIIIGAPSIQPEELLQMAHCIWHDDEAPIDDTMVKDGNWRPYQYREEETGNGYAVEVREFKDKRLNLLLKTYREYEIAQAAHRIRPILYPGEKKIWLLTNLPIDELPPTKLTKLDEIIAETDPQFLQFVDIVKRIVAELTGVWGELLVENSECHECNSIYILLQTWHSENLSRRTMLRWFQRAVKLLGYEATTVTIGGNVRLKVWHDGNMDEDKIRKLYHESQEAKNESKQET